MPFPLRISLIAIVVFISVCGCNSADPVSTEDAKGDTTAVDTVSKSAGLDTLRMAYHLFYTNDSLRKKWSSQFSVEEFNIIAGINCIDVARLSNLDSLVVPDTFLSDWLLYAPFPQRLEVADSLHFLLLVSYPIQAFAAYQQGELKRWGPVCMGKKATPTPTGFFHTNWKSKRQISTENPDWILPWYFNLVNATGVSLHQFDLPGYPASHSCIRLRMEDAQWIYEQARQWRLSADQNQVLGQGSPVIIYGAYPFGKARPWYALAKDSSALNQSADTLNTLIQPLLEQMLKEQRVRDSIQ